MALQKTISCVPKSISSHRPVVPNTTKHVLLGCKDAIWLYKKKRIKMIQLNWLHLSSSSPNTPPRTIYWFLSRKKKILYNSCRAAQLSFFFYSLQYLVRHSLCAFSSTWKCCWEVHLYFSNLVSNTVQIKSNSCLQIACFLWPTLKNQKICNLQT